MLIGCLDSAQVAADVANDLGRVGQEADVAGVFDDLELRTQDSLREAPVAGTRER